MIDRGDRFFDEERYEEAIAEYTAALRLTGHHDLVWNIGRAHEELGQLTQAIAFFERYRQMDVSAEDGATAASKIEALRARQQEEERGTLVVQSSQPGAAIRVGGAAVGQGGTVEVPLRVGRYRVQVDLEGYQPFEQIVMVAANARIEVHAVLEPDVVTGTLQVLADVENAEVFVDEIALGKVGDALSVVAGAHKLRVSAERRPSVEQLIEVVEGETLTVEVKLGPVAAPEQYESWQGRFRALLWTDELREQLGQSVLVFSESGEGELIAEYVRDLRPWQVEACGGASEVRWVLHYKATLQNEGAVPATLQLTEPRQESCSCTTYCPESSSHTLSLIPMPGREGLVAEGVLFLREDLLDSDVQAAHVSPGQWGELEGRWEVLTWTDAQPRTGEHVRFELEGESVRGSLFRRSSGPVPSYERGKCRGQSQYAQGVTYPVRVSRSDEAIQLDFRPGESTQCSCPGGCGRPEILASVRVKPLVFRRYLFGSGLLLRHRQ